MRAPVLQKSRSTQAMQAPPAGAAPDRGREFDMRDTDFDALREIIKSKAGISLSTSKQEMVYSRVSRRLRHLKLRTFTEYRRLLETDEVELVEFCNAMTTNLTAFFRESHHFDYLRHHVLEPRLRDPRASRRIRIWSAACSSGEEAYSIAMVVRETLQHLSRWDVRILATDLDTDILARAKAGVYPEERVKAVGRQRLQTHFSSVADRPEHYRVAPELASLITFKQLNLTHALPMSGPLDAIFCRNVVIYFDKETQRDLFERISVLQRSDDLLFLGHSESLFKVSEAYALLGRTIYRRV
jgi:chemotaxis protein methyltransferase CheR